MKTKARNGLIVASFACVTISSALCLTAGGHSAFAEADYSEPNANLVACEQALQMVSEDLESIVDGYNKVYGSDWAASEIEYATTVFILDDSEYGIYVDLDGDNGYFVMTADNKLYGLETNGDLDYLRGVDNFYFDSADGFLYIDGSGHYQRYEQKENQFEDEIIGSPQIIENASRYSVSNLMASDSRTIKCPNNGEVGDDGQIEPGTLNSYVSAHYPGFKFDSEGDHVISGFNCAYQLDTSYYIQEYTNKSISSEGNCALNAMYNVMRNWGDRGYINVPYNSTNDISITILDDILYSEYGRGGKFGENEHGRYVWKANEASTLSVMPVLYSNIRGYAIKNGYTVMGYKSNKIPATMQYVMNFLYGNNMCIWEATSLYDVRSSIFNDKACLLAMYNSSTYNNHGVAVIGYHRYAKTTTIDATHSNTEYKYFFEIADGWSYTSQIFDPNVSPNLNLEFYYLSRC